MVQDHKNYPRYNTRLYTFMAHCWATELKNSFM